LYALLVPNQFPRFQLLAVGGYEPEVGGRSGELFGRIVAPIGGELGPLKPYGGPTGFTCAGPYVDPTPAVFGHGRAELDGGMTGFPEKTEGFHGLLAFGARLLGGNRTCWALDSFETNRHQQQQLSKIDNRLN